MILSPDGSQRIAVDRQSLRPFDASGGARHCPPHADLQQSGKTVEIIGLNDPSADLRGKLTGELTRH
ncbi:hypothetical protein OG594_35820 [Streptomyces sp. NBC_01214]|uniref:hypothetical protein n=1 Tax=Streptomyces sp. NBC_01214 TaxID=2903777 RepID=UPI0022575BF4|nr:hypothetical protein [Streptomyces sp. NBC_01214]MCX4806931.1 hypothetical protein [Streptomyces sp. NBC_01214]